MTLAVLLAHGSPDRASGDAVRVAAERISQRIGAAVVAAFLDHDAPSLEDAVAEQHGPVVVLPLLLAAAYHARVDVPAAVTALGRDDVTLLDPLGHPPAVLDGRLQQAPAPVVVVAAGTRVDEERAAFAAAVQAASVRTGVAAAAAFASGPGPAPGDVADVGSYVPWLLAPGRLMARVAAEAADRDVPLAAAHLLADPRLLDVIADRLALAPHQ